MKTTKLAMMAGVASAAAMLGACSMSQPYGGLAGGGHASYSAPSYSASYGGTAYRGGSTVTGVNERTYYAPRVNPTYGASPTTIGSSAPYGSAVHYGGGYGGGYGRPALRQAGYSYASLGATLYDVDSNTAGLQGRLGYQFSPLLGVEAEGSIGLLDDDTTVAGTTTENKVDYQAAAFARARLPIGPRLSVHARGGYHALEASADTTVGGVTTAVSANDDGFAYGAGAEYALSPRDAIRLDYTNYEVTGSNLDSVAIAYQRRF